MGAAYPSDELQWLSTTLFNLAANLYAAEQEEAAKMWAIHSVELADVMALTKDEGGGNHGSLARTLRQKGRSVNWEL